MNNLSLLELDRLIAEAKALRTNAFETALAALQERVRNEAAAMGIDYKNLFHYQRGNVVRFRGPEGQSWNGVGPNPKWLKDLRAQGHTLDEYRV